MDVAISGSTGLIGTALRRSLERDGHRVVSITRGSSPHGAAVGWDPEAGTIDAAGLEGVDAVVHLAGEGIASHRWTDEQRRRIEQSRTKGTDLLARTLAGLDRKPAVMLSGSAIGYYGNRGDEELNEASSPGSDFLARVCRAWEAATAPAEDAGLRVAHLRTGIVLSSAGGALAKQLLPFKLGLGGRAGSGRQWLGWISLADEVRAIRFLLDNPVSGAVNLTAPEPVTNAEFARTLGKVLHRPAVVPIPRIVSKLPLGVGPLAESLLFSGAKVRPDVLVEAGFAHHHTDLEAALADILGHRHESAA